MASILERQADPRLSGDGFPTPEMLRDLARHGRVLSVPPGLQPDKKLAPILKYGTRHETRRTTIIHRRDIVDALVSAVRGRARVPKTSDDDVGRSCAAWELYSGLLKDVGLLTDALTAAGIRCADGWDIQREP